MKSKRKDQPISVVLSMKRVILRQDTLSTNSHTIRAITKDRVTLSRFLKVDTISDLKRSSRMSRGNTPSTGVLTSC